MSFLETLPFACLRTESPCGYSCVSVHLPDVVTMAVGTAVTPPLFQTMPNLPPPQQTDRSSSAVLPLSQVS